MEPTIFKAMLDLMPEEALGKFGSSMGPSIVRENLARLGMNADRDSIEFMLAESLGQWTKWYDADVNENPDGRVYYLHHVLGKKWSVFLKNFFEQVTAELLNLNVSVEMTENSVIFTLPNTIKPFKRS